MTDHGIDREADRWQQERDEMDRERRHHLIGPAVIVGICALAVVLFLMAVALLYAWPATNGGGQ